MRDVLEEELAARLRELGDVTPEELEPPADLETRVIRTRKDARNRRYGTAFAVAAALLVVVAAVTVLDGRTEKDPVVAAPVNDPLPAGTVMLGAKDRYITARDATGKILATMVTTTRGMVLDAQVTADHKTIFYRVADGENCDKIARADIDGRTSSFVARGHAFAISPDGTQMVISGYGDLERGQCLTNGAPGDATVIRRNLVTGSVSAGSDTNWDRFDWSSDGRTQVRSICPAYADCGYYLMDGPDATATRLDVRGDSPPAFGRDGLYLAQASRFSPGGAVFVIKPPDLAPRKVSDIAPGWRVIDIVPLDSELLVTATPPLGRTGLYRVQSGRLELVNNVDPGRVRPVSPLVAP